MGARKAAIRIGFVGLQALSVLLILELTLLAGLNHPRWVRDNLPRPVLDYLRVIYAHFDQRIIQYERGAARWDSELFYTLRPGEFVFSNREFSNRFRVNSAGFRDEEQKLDGPELLILGDSFAMGWGVDADQRFGALLEKQLGRKTLHVAVSSWGTARQAIALRRLDLSRVKQVVIQFSQNDNVENLEFVTGGMKLQIQGEGVWSESLKGYEKGHRYHFGRYALKSVNEVAGKFKGLLGAVFASREARAELTDDWRLHVDNFAAIVGHMKKQGLRSARFTMFAPDETPPEALKYLRSKKVEHLQVLDLVSQLNRDEHFYVLDSHLTAAGHAEIARLLLPYLK